MDVFASSSPLSDIDAAWLAVGIFEGEAATNPPVAPELIAGLVASKDLAGSTGEATPLFGAAPDGGSILVVGLGKASAYNAGAAFSAGVAIAKRLSTKPRPSLAVACPPGDAKSVSALVEGLIVGTVGPGLHKAEPNRHPFGLLTIVAHEASTDKKEFAAAVRRGQIVGEAVNLARDLVNTPPSEKTPAILAEKAATLAREAGIDVEVWDRDRLVAERFGGVLAVSSGSDKDPRFVRLRYRNGGDAPLTSLVGKGVTFDSGGLSLKPSASMEDMKCDMAGAAAVLAAALAVARLGLPVNVDSTFALTENMTGGGAMKLGDVLTIRNGLTVEVLNTDAEGRLVLADILSLATEEKPARIIDLATLTGACLVALGTRIAGLFSNDDALAADLLAACKATGERAWRMPIDDDFNDAIKSKVAEIKNTGNKWGGAITASKFLQRFVGETPWAHLDIAGPAWSDDDSSTRDAGGTGCFVRTLVELLERAS
jgi:leucyl aminopeptidase